ncbi:hypothetical protein RCO48_23410 [Peribacillus frigoritolerans]|nr:hypothetical protein [Peribacillus frigoritolerans]
MIFAMKKIVGTVSQMHPRSVVDFGSGEGKLSVRLGFIEGVKEILAVEPSESASIKALGRFDKVKDKEKIRDSRDTMGFTLLL